MYLMFLKDITNKEIEESSLCLLRPGRIFDQEPPRVEVFQGVAVHVYGPLTLPSSGRVVYWVRDTTTGVACLATEDTIMERVGREDRVEEAQSIALQCVEKLDQDTYSAALMLSNLRAEGRWRALVGAKGEAAWEALCRERLGIAPGLANALVEQARSINREMASGSYPIPEGFPDDDASLAKLGRLEREIGDSIASLTASHERASWGSSKTRLVVKELGRTLPMLCQRLRDGNIYGQTALNAAFSFGPPEYRPVSSDPVEVEKAFHRVFEGLFGESKGTFGRLAALAPHLDDEGD